jgi:hypothetical protein
MANRLYHNYANKMMGSSSAAHALADLENDIIKVYLLDAGTHSTSLSGNVDEADITDVAILSTATLAGGSITSGMFDATDTTFTAVTGSTGEEVILWFDSGVATTSPLICNFDTASAGLPVTPNGGNIVIEWGSSLIDLLS